MWSNGGDTNEHGEPILLLQPITKNKHKKKCNLSPSSSHIGGLPCFYSSDISPKSTDTIICTLCNEPMYLLLQLNAPLDDLERTLYVFGCNRPSCHVVADKVEDCNGSRGMESKKCPSRLDSFSIKDLSFGLLLLQCGDKSRYLVRVK